MSSADPPLFSHSVTALPEDMSALESLEQLNLEGCDALISIPDLSALGVEVDTQSGRFL